MPRGRSLEDLTTLQMALVGYQVEKQKIEDQIRRIEAQLKGKRVPLSSAAAAPAKPAGTHRGRAEKALGGAPQARRAEQAGLTGSPLRNSSEPRSVPSRLPGSYSMALRKRNRDMIRASYIACPTRLTKCYDV